MITGISPPKEIQDSLKKFHVDNGDPMCNGFVIMRFDATIGHTSILEAIKKTLKEHRLKALRADDKQYHDDLLSNILTYLYGCSFGIAVFERLEMDSFNPNVSFEAGYLMALKKPVCLLKDRTLKTLHSDLIGRLYHAFDPYEPNETIPKVLGKWLIDKGFSRKLSESIEPSEDKHIPEWILNHQTCQDILMVARPNNSISMKKFTNLLDLKASYLDEPIERLLNAGLLTKIHTSKLLAFYKLSDEGETVRRILLGKNKGIN
jgi:hypothetical protein